MIDELELAIKSSEDDHMRESLLLLIRSLMEGDLKFHIDSGKEWVKASNQQVDT